MHEILQNFAVPIRYLDAAGAICDEFSFSAETWSTAKDVSFVNRPEKPIWVGEGNLRESFPLMLSEIDDGPQTRHPFGYLHSKH